MAAVDPVTLEVVGNYLVSAVREMLYRRKQTTMKLERTLGRGVVKETRQVIRARPLNDCLWFCLLPESRPLVPKLARRR